MINIVYRISEAGYSKIKPEFINNTNCFKNAIKRFPISKYKWMVVADSVSDNTKQLLESYLDINSINYVNIKNGPGYPFMYILDKCLSVLPDSDIVYFIENDYVHKENADIILKEGFDIGADYVTLYDHPDKYMLNGPNPYVEDGAEVTRVYLSNTCHWKLTNSTTGTFAAKVITLKNDYDIIKKYANNIHWSDFDMFIELRNSGRSLISPIPGYSTHGETAWLTPLTDWNLEII